MFKSCVSFQKFSNDSVSNFFFKMNSLLDSKSKKSVVFRIFALIPFRKFRDFLSNNAERRRFNKTGVLFELAIFEINSRYNVVLNSSNSMISFS